MKTDELIGAIVQDGTGPGFPLAVRMLAAVAAGGIVSAVLFGWALGVRPDIGNALQTVRFLLKLAIVLATCALAWWATAQLARPDAHLHRVLAALVLAPALLAMAAGVELLVVSPGVWLAKAIGSNARVCLVAIPLLSLAPLAALLVALQSGAPRSPPIAGAVAGVLAASIGASLYATHCTDDSPLFVAVWYPLAIALVAAVGAAAGYRALRW